MISAATSEGKLKKTRVREGSQVNKIGSAESVGRDRAMRGDRAFKIAMLNARRWRRESFTIGVDKRPCTDQPVFVGREPVPPRSAWPIEF